MTFATIPNCENISSIPSPFLPQIHPQNHPQFPTLTRPRVLRKYNRTNSRKNQLSTNQNINLSPDIKLDIKPEVKPEVKSDVKPEIKSDVKPEIKSDENQNEFKFGDWYSTMIDQIMKDTKSDSTDPIIDKVKTDMKSFVKDYKLEESMEKTYSLLKDLNFNSDTKLTNLFNEFNNTLDINSIVNNLVDSNHMSHNIFKQIYDGLIDNPLAKDILKDIQNITSNSESILTKPTVEPITQPSVKPIPAPISKPIFKPTAKYIPQPIVRPITKPVDSLPKPVLSGNIFSKYQSPSTQNFLNPGNHFCINTCSVKKNDDSIKLDDNKMTQEWIQFNNDIFSNCQNYHNVEPSCTGSFKNNFASISDFDCTLLNNTNDKFTQNNVQFHKNADKSLVKKLSNIENKVITEIVDNFNDTNDQLVSPKTIIDELIKVKSRLSNDTTLKPVTDPLGEIKYYINLQNYCINPRLIEKIRKVYRDKYIQKSDDLHKTIDFPYHRPIDHSFFSIHSNNLAIQMEKGKVFAIIDQLINKYRCLDDDRKILDQADELGDEIADTVEEYQRLMKQINQYETYKSKLNALFVGLNELDTMSKDLNLVDFGSNIIHSNFKTSIGQFQNNINQERLEHLIQESKNCQAKFNYYKKMTNEILKRINVIDNTVYKEAPKQTIRQTTEEDKIYTYSPKETTQQHTFIPYNFQLRSDPKIPTNFRFEDF